MNQTSTTPLRDVVVAMADHDGNPLTQWLVNIPASISNDDALPQLAPQLLQFAIEDGEISASEQSANFNIRDADPAIDADLYLSLAEDSTRH